MKSYFRVVERRLGVFSVQRRGSLWGWTFIYNDHRGRDITTWSKAESAEQWVKEQIPHHAFRSRVISEWFINGEKKPNGK